MAVEILEKTRRPGVSMGRRVDGAVRARREGGGRERSLQVVREAPAQPRPAADSLGRRARGEVRVLVAPMRCDRIRPEGDAPIVPAVPARVVAPVAVPRATPKTDPMFDVHIEQARKVATRVRGLRRGAPGAASSQVEAQARLRLTVRGRRVLVALGFAFSIAIGGLVGTLIGTEPLPEHTATVVVKPGDSLWSIAETMVEPGRDLRPVMEQIAALNGLNSSIISAGQSLVVPAE